MKFYTITDGTTAIQTTIRAKNKGNALGVFMDTMGSIKNKEEVKIEEISIKELTESLNEFYEDFDLHLLPGAREGGLPGALYEIIMSENEEIIL